jgi:phenylacetate-CoA ligase
MTARGFLLTAAMRALYPGLLPAYRACREAEQLSREALRARQLERLRAQVALAYREIPFYRDLWDRHGVRPEVRTWEDFAHFPLLDKPMVQAGLEAGAFALERFPARRLLAQSTTGSSGAPFAFLEDRRGWEWKMGKEYAVYAWYDYHFGDACAWFWRGKLRPPLLQRLKEALMNRRTWCVYDPEEPVASALDDNRLAGLAARLRRERPPILDGFPSTLALLAAWMEARGVSPGYAPRAVVCGGEMLDVADRARLRRVFGAPVFNRYGGTETGLIGHECRAQAEGDHHLHLNTETVFIEAVREDRPVTGEPGEVVATHLWQSAVPLIRYRVGDLITLDPALACPCGRPQPLITAVQGRVNDVFVLPDGRLITTHLWQNYLKKAPVIRRYQMVQETETLVRVHYERDPAVRDDGSLEKVRRLVADALPGCRVEWREVARIEPGPGGKFRHCLSRLPPERKRLGAHATPLAIPGNKSEGGRS